MRHAVAAECERPPREPAAGDSAGATLLDARNDPTKTGVSVGMRSVGTISE